MSNQIPQQPLPDKAIEKEFIYNLQQQVYFLELQGRLLREKMTEEKKQKSRGVEANPAFDSALDEALPLTQLFERLRTQFMQQQNEFKFKEEEFQKQIDDLKEKNNELSLQNELYDQYKIQEKERKLLQRQNFDHVLELQSNENADLKEQVKLQKLQYDMINEQLSKVNNIVNEQSEKLTVSNGEIKALNQQVSYLKQNIPELLEEQLSQATFQIQEFQAKLKEQQVEIIAQKKYIEEINQQKFQLAQSNDLSSVEIRTLQNQVNNLQNELRDTTKSLSSSRQQIQQLEQDAKVLSSRNKVLQDFTVDIQNVINSYSNKRLIDQLESQISSLKGDVQKHVDDSKKYILKDQQQILENDAQTSQINKLNDKINTQNQDVLAKNSLNQQLQLKLQALDNEVADKSNIIDENGDVIEKQLARIQFLEAELLMKQELSHMQLEEFEELRKSNAALGLMLNGLTDKFTNLGQKAESYDKFDKIEKDKKLARAALYNRKNE